MCIIRCGSWKALLLHYIVAFFETSVLKEVRVLSLYLYNNITMLLTNVQNKALVYFMFHKAFFTFSQLNLFFGNVVYILNFVKVPYFSLEMKFSAIKTSEDIICYLFLQHDVSFYKRLYEQ